MAWMLPGSVRSTTEAARTAVVIVTVGKVVASSLASARAAFSTSSCRVQPNRKIPAKSSTSTITMIATDLPEARECGELEELVSMDVGVTIQFRPHELRGQFHARCELEACCAGRCT